MLVKYGVALFGACKELLILQDLFNSLRCPKMGSREPKLMVVW